MSGRKRKDPETVRLERIVDREELRDEVEKTFAFFGWDRTSRYRLANAIIACAQAKFTREINGVIRASELAAEVWQGAPAESGELTNRGNPTELRVENLGPFNFCGIEKMTHWARPVEVVRLQCRNCGRRIRPQLAVLRCALRNGPIHCKICGAQN